MTVRIDGQDVTVEEGCTVLEAATRLGIRIPTVCHVPGLDPAVSCMVCVVRDTRSGRLLPACSTVVTGGEEIDTLGPEVLEARKLAVELQLDRHGGDCVAPCELACPCRIPMPKVLRALRAGEAREARRLLEERCALPLSAALTCPAYCEKACRRKDLDHAVGMRALHLLAAETPEEPQRSRMKARPHRRIALTDASPAALGCAHRLHLLGHDVFVVRRLRCAEGIPREALDDDLGTLERTGIRFLNEETRLDPSAFDAVLDASDFPGHPEAHPVVRALAIGRDAADRVLLRLAGCSEVLLPQRACRAGKLSARELSALLPETQDERSEAWRCLHCDCRAADDCRLRSAADRLQAWRVPPPPRPAIEPDYSHPDLVHEPNKCIACGACLRIARLRQEPVGLSWHGRGADLRVAPPLGKTWKEALTHAAAECVKACPTASLAWKREAGPPCPVQAG